MADQKLRELTAITDSISTDIIYLVHDPGGTPVDRKIEIGSLLGNDGAWVNLVKNSPGQIYGAAKDGAEPEWWDDIADATITDEDAAGEGIPELTERVFKVEEVKVDVPDFAPIFDNVQCTNCGENVMATRIVDKDGEKLCIPCAHADHLWMDGSGLKKSNG